MRADAKCCSVRCRQARHRFTVGVGVPAGVADGRALRLAYADPPYPGLARTYYEDHPDYAGEVDHPALIRRLSTYDGWALSTSASALPEVLASCPPGVRVAAWHRGERPTRSAGPLNAWEPVIYSGGRVAVDDRHEAPLRVVAAAGETEPFQGSARRIDSLVYHSRPRLTDPDRVIGAKPAVFCRWVFDLLGARPGDDLEDVFPGSGGVLRAWETYTMVKSDAYDHRA